MKLTFKNDMEIRDSYYIPNQHKNAVGLFNLADLVQNDFTMLCTAKPDWELCGTDHWSAYGILSINGMDLGIYCIKDKNGRKCLRAEFWVDNNNPQVKYTEISSDDLDLDNELNLAFEFKKNKYVKLVCNEVEKKIEFTEDLIDYTTSWLWVGAANHRWNVDGALWRGYKGEVSNISIYGSVLNRQIYSYFEDREFFDDNKYNPFFIMSKDNRTPYKIFDESGNGNHLCLNMYNLAGRNLMY
jgi:hypothetical protein